MTNHRIGMPRFEPLKCRYCSAVLAQHCGDSIDIGGAWIRSRVELRCKACNCHQRWHPGEKLQTPLAEPAAIS